VRPAHERRVWVAELFKSPQARPTLPVKRCAESHHESHEASLTLAAAAAAFSAAASAAALSAAAAAATRASAAAFVFASRAAAMSSCDFFASSRRFSACGEYTPGLLESFLWYRPGLFQCRFRKRYIEDPKIAGFSPAKGVLLPSQAVPGSTTATQQPWSTHSTQRRAWIWHIRARTHQAAHLPSRLPLHSPSPHGRRRRTIFSIAVGSVDLGALGACEGGGSDGASILGISIFGISILGSSILGISILGSSILGISMAGAGGATTFGASTFGAALGASGVASMMPPKLKSNLGASNLGISMAGAGGATTGGAVITATPPSLLCDTQQPRGERELRLSRTGWARGVDAATEIQIHVHVRHEEAVGRVLGGWVGHARSLLRRA
jgi:hypothetical protein